MLHIYFYISVQLYLFISVFLCPYVNEVGGPNLSTCQHGEQYYIQDAMHTLCALSHSTKSEPQLLQKERKQ